MLVVTPEVTTSQTGQNDGARSQIEDQEEGR
jgi:hypothetical protein